MIMGFKKNLLAFITIGALGTLFHFVYEWTGENRIVGFFVPVNESIWEHLKLIFYPALIYFAGEFFLTKERYENFIPQIGISIFCGMFTTVLLYYLYTGILGYNVDILNIAIFFISIIILIIKRNKVYNLEKYNTKNAKIIFSILLITTALLFGLWSVTPPSLGIFTPPTNNTK